MTKEERYGNGGFYVSPDETFPIAVPRPALKEFRKLISRAVAINTILHDGDKPLTAVVIAEALREYIDRRNEKLAKAAGVKL